MQTLVEHRDTANLTSLTQAAPASSTSPATTFTRLEKVNGTSNVALFQPLEQLTRPNVPTEQAAYYLDRRPQTLRFWAMKDGTGPLRPMRINGRLAWPVSELRRVLGVQL